MARDRQDGAPVRCPLCGAPAASTITMADVPVVACPCVDRLAPRGGFVALDLSKLKSPLESMLSEGRPVVAGDRITWSVKL